MQMSNSKLIQLIVDFPPQWGDPTQYIPSPMDAILIDSSPIVDYRRHAIAF